MTSELRARLVETCLQWQDKYGVAPSITSALSEYDAAILIGCSDQQYSDYMQGGTAVRRGHDFVFDGLRYQVKANRPSGRRGSFVTWVPKPTNYEWDHLVWLLYDRQYNLLEAWRWPVAEYRRRFEQIERLSPTHMREGERLR